MIDTCEKFNEKYAEFLEKDQHGLTIEVPGIVMYLDQIFNDLTQIPGFRYSHIGTHMGMAKLYNSLPEILPYVGRTMDKAIEERLNFILTVEREIEQRMKHGNTI